MTHLSLLLLLVLYQACISDAKIMPLLLFFPFFFFSLFFSFFICFFSFSLFFFSFSLFSLSFSVFYFFSVFFLFFHIEDDVMEQRSGSSTPQRSCSAAGLQRPRLSIDAAAAAECQSLMGSLSGSFVGSIPSVPPRLGSHTMDFFEMCASLIMALAR